MAELNVRLFGAFRNWQEEPNLSVELPGSECSVADLREMLAVKFRARPLASFDAAGLLGKAAIANDKSVLLESDLVRSGENLALLPPVSGG